MKKLQIALIVILTVTMVLIGILAYVTNGFADWDFRDVINPYKTLSLYLDGEECTSISTGHHITINVVGADEFTVQVLPGKASFDYRHNGALVRFPYIDGDLTKAFGITIGDGCFDVCLQDMSIEKVLQSLHPEETITDISAIDDNASYFIIKVTGNGQTAELLVSGFYAYLHLELDQTEIIF